MRRRAGGSPVTSTSPIVMRPDESVSSPAMRRSVVDFPQPDGPEQHDQRADGRVEAHVVHGARGAPGFADALEGDRRHG